MPSRDKRPLVCRLATRWSADASGGQRTGTTVRWARRHLARCPQCQAEAREWRRVLDALRQIGRPAAPPHLYGAVMARIAGERARGARRTPGAHIPKPSRFPACGGLTDAGLSVALGAALAWWALTSGAGPIMFAPLANSARSVLSAPARLWGNWLASFLVTQDYAGTVAWIERVAAGLATGAEPFLAAVLWGAAGLAITAVLAPGLRPGRT